jgi:hypothetical protein
VTAATPAQPVDAGLEALLRRMRLQHMRRIASSIPRDQLSTDWRGSANLGRNPARLPAGNRQILSGRSSDRRRAVLVSASGQLPGRLRAVSRGRRQQA